MASATITRRVLEKDFFLSRHYYGEASGAFLEIERVS
jgi:hypothetical protein